MQQHEVPETSTSEEREPPLWVPPPPPAHGPGDWLHVVIERFGFVLAVVATLLVLGLLFLNADWLLREPGSVVENEPVAESPPPVSGEASATVPLSIATVPAHAGVYVNGDSVGRTPLHEFSLPAGTHHIALRKASYETLDTTVTLASVPLALALTLHAQSAEEEPEDVPTGSEEQLSEGAPLEDDLPLAEVDEPEPVAEGRTQQAEPVEEASSSPPQRTVSEEAASPEPPALGSVRILSQPSGATVLLDGESLGVTPFTMRDVEAGAYQLVLQRDGFEESISAFTVVAEEMNTVNVELQPVMGTLRILARPWGAIYIDGELHKEESSVWYTVQLPPGPHRVRVEHPALGKWENEVTVVADEEESLRVDFNKGQQQ